jgi:hypothetical protein
MIIREHDLPITKQAEVPNVSRGSVYYLPRPVSAIDLEIMRRLDRLHLSAYPASPPAGPAMQAFASAWRRRTGRSAGDGRFAEAFAVRSTSLAGVPGFAWSWASPRFWS